MFRLNVVRLAKALEGREDSPFLKLSLESVINLLRKSGARLRYDELTRYLAEVILEQEENNPIVVNRFLEFLVSNEDYWVFSEDTLESRSKEVRQYINTQILQGYEINDKNNIELLNFEDWKSFNLSQLQAVYSQIKPLHEKKHMQRNTSLSATGNSGNLSLQASHGDNSPNTNKQTSQEPAFDKDDASSLIMALLKNENNIFEIDTVALKDIQTKLFDSSEDEGLRKRLGKQIDRIVEGNKENLSFLANILSSLGSITALLPTILKPENWEIIKHLFETVRL